MRTRFTRRTALVIATIALAVGAPMGIALASHTFTDVPTGHTFHADIAAVAASGVAKGCAVDRYCPDGLVTRGQMAAFLNRLGALAPDKPPVVNADQVDGIDASGLIRVASVRITDTSAGLPADPSYTTYGSPLTFTAPSAGYVVINGTVTVLNSNASPCTASCHVGAWIGHTGDSSTYGFADMTVSPTGSSRESVALSVLVPVNAGTHYFDIRLHRFGGTTGLLHGWWGSLTAVFSPFGASGNSLSTLGAPGAGQADADVVTKEAP